MLIRKPDGHELIITASASPLRDASSKINGSVAVFHDITQEKMVENLKDEFLSIVSHMKLRTPLTAIMGYSDLMMRGVHGRLTDRQGKVLRAVRANADRLLQLINNILMFPSWKRVRCVSTPNLPVSRSCIENDNPNTGAGSRCKHLNRKPYPSAFMAPCGCG